MSYKLRLVLKNAQFCFCLCCTTCVLEVCNAKPTKNTSITDITSVTEFTTENDSSSDYYDFLGSDYETIKIDPNLTDKIQEPTPPPTSCADLNTNIVTVDIISVWLVSFISAFACYFKEINRAKITWVNCIGGGILFGTCFFHLLPEVIEKFGRDKKKSFGVYLSVGFFLMMILEQFFATYWHKLFRKAPIAQGCCKMDEKCENEAKLLKQSDESAVSQSSDDSIICTEDRPINSTDYLRYFALITSISVCCTVEGAFLVLRSKSWDQNLPILISMLVKKLPIGFIMGFKLKNSSLTTTHAKTMLFVWTLYSAVGGSFTFLFCNLNWVETSAIAPLNAIGLGLFLYVLFFEITPSEFLENQPGNKLWKSLVMVGGVGLSYWLSQVLEPGCGHSHD